MKVGDRVRVVKQAAPVMWTEQGHERRDTWGTVVEVLQNCIAVKHDTYEHVRDYLPREIAQVALSNTQRPKRECAGCGCLRRVNSIGFCRSCYGADARRYA